MSLKQVVDRLIGNRRVLWALSAGVLWIMLVAVLAGMLMAFKLDLQNGIMTELRTSLASFLENNQFQSFGPDAYLSTIDEHALGDLEFIRITGRQQHFLFSSIDNPAFDFRFLSDLDPRLSGCWITVGDERQQLVFNIVSQPFGNNLQIQAGRTDKHLYALYERCAGRAMTGAMIALPLAMIIAWIGIVLSHASLRRLADQLAGLDRSSHTLLDIGSASSAEYRRVSQEVNRIVLQNQALVKEMQSALDSVAHDLRTPMSRLRSIAEYGLRAGDDASVLRDSLAGCLEEAERIQAMLQTMMSVAEAESGTMQLSFERVCLADQIAEVIELYRYVAEDDGIVVSATVPTDLTVWGDRTRLVQVWANLLDNGIKYNRERGMVTISAVRQDSEVHVCFRDTGIGIAPHEQQRIWERLYRGDRSRSKPGLGLGLNYVKAVIAAHHGHIEMTSMINEGSAFTVYLPAVPQQQTAGRFPADA